MLIKTAFEFKHRSENFISNFSVNFEKINELGKAGFNCVIRHI